jgi:hypothetical protein
MALLLFRVAILGNEIAGVTGEHEIFHLALATRSKIDHFPNVGKMVQSCSSIITPKPTPTIASTHPFPTVSDHEAERQSSHPEYLR